jgi:hypothetical protein
MFSRAAMAVAMLVALAVPAAAQPRPKIIRLTPVEIHGTVTAIGPTALSATSAAGEPWLLQVSEETVIHVTGTAEADMLQPKRFVRVQGIVDKRQSRMKDKVDRITLIMPAKDGGRIPGAFYQGQQPEEESDLPVPGKVPPPKFAPPPELPGQPKPARPAAKGKAPDSGKDSGAAPNEEFLDIRGSIARIKGSQLTIDVPNALFKSPLRVDLDAKLTIDVDLPEYSMVKPGDKIAARGVQMGNRVADVRELNIVLSNSLTTKKRPLTKPLAKQPVPRAKPGEQEPVEVAGGKTKPADPPAKPELPAGRDQPPDKEPPAADGDPADKILPLLSLKPDELKGKAALSIAFNAGDPLLFIPAKEETIESIRKQFGNPKEVQNVQGSLPVGEEGARKEVRWQVWTYGSLKIFVDDTGKVRYFHLGKK